MAREINVNLEFFLKDAMVLLNTLARHVNTMQASLVWHRMANDVSIFFHHMTLL